MPGSAHPPGGATASAPSPARLALAAGLLLVGIGDLALVNLVLLPRYLAVVPGHPPSCSCPEPSGPAALPTAQVPLGGGAVASAPTAEPRQPLDGAAAPAASGAPAGQEGAATPPSPAAAESPRPSAPEGAAPEPGTADFPDLLFARNATWLSAASRETLDTLADALKAGPERRVILRGHTDRVGSPELNRWLSLARARRASRYLQARGIATARIDIESFGSQRPADEEQTLAAQARNRRVEIEVH
jgi:outer membrane protein OmpA-like peptidoglycan-associated protein